jgi:hypothetical protein
MMKLFRSPSRALLILLLLTGGLRAQTTAPVKVAELQERVRQGVQLVNDGKKKEALEVFLGIIKDEPKAKGSLFYAGKMELQLGDPEASADYLSRFRELAPTDFRGIIGLIQANQALRRTVKVDALRKELFDLRSSSNLPGFSDANSYVREQIFGDKDSLINLSEFFDYHTAPNIVYEGSQYNGDGNITRHLMVMLNTDETAAARAKNPKFAEVEVFDFSEEVLKDGKSVQLNIYSQEYEKPTYEAARKWILDAIKEPPKPLQVVPLQ